MIPQTNVSLGNKILTWLTHDNSSRKNFKVNRTIPKGGDHVTILFCGVHCFTDKKVPISFNQLFSLFSWDVSMKPGLFLEIFATNYFVLAIIKKLFDKLFIWIVWISFQRHYSSQQRNKLIFFYRDAEYQLSEI